MISALFTGRRYVEELAKRYGVEKAVSINVWRCGEKSADEINTRLQTAESSRNVRMDGSKANVGMADSSNRSGREALNL